MGWKIRIRGENLYHHIYAWGNDRHPVFKEKKHYQKYLSLLEKISLLFEIDVIAYALMEWHVHLFIFDKLNTISNFMMKLHGDFAQYFNKDTKRVGHVFGERFNNKIVMPNIYGMWLSRYIHRQPVEANLVADPKDYPWTSYRVYLGLEKKKFLKPEIILGQFGTDRDRFRKYKEFVMSDNDGPVDWSQRVFRMRSGKDLIVIASQEMGINPSLIANPEGVQARYLRCQAIRVLVNKYGYKGSQVASAFGLTRAAVTKILKR